MDKGQEYLEHWDECLKIAHPTTKHTKMEYWTEFCKKEGMNRPLNEYHGMIDQLPRNRKLVEELKSIRIPSKKKK